MNKHFSLYIHVPFCISKCAYCDFNSYAGMDDLIPAYFDALNKEAAFWAPQFETKKIDTIYIGGGTPSYVEPRYITDILQTAGKYYHLCENCEISMESNPGTLNREKCVSYKQAGINRISLGAQAVQEPLLKMLGRAHTFEDILNSVEYIRCAGFNNLNFDVMFGLPMQTMDDWRETLNQILLLSPEHISAYSLIVEEGTLFYEHYPTMDEDEKDRDMYHYLCAVLPNRGYPQYEISNFAINGRECRHNLYCWEMEEYLGLGLNAHSFTGCKRYANDSTLKGYIDAVTEKGTAKIFEHNLSRRELIGDYMMLGLRKTGGINLIDFKESFNVDLMDIFHNETYKLVRKGLLTLKTDNLSLTNRGLDYANYVMREYL